MMKNYWKATASKMWKSCFLTGFKMFFEPKQKLHDRPLADQAQAASQKCYKSLANFKNFDFDDEKVFKNVSLQKSKKMIFDMFLNGFLI